MLNALVFADPVPSPGALETLLQYGVLGVGVIAFVVGWVVPGTSLRKVLEENARLTNLIETKVFDMSVSYATSMMRRPRRRIATPRHWTGAPWHWTGRSRTGYTRRSRTMNLIRPRKSVKDALEQAEKNVNERRWDDIEDEVQASRQQLENSLEDSRRRPSSGWTHRDDEAPPG